MGFAEHSGQLYFPSEAIGVGIATGAGCKVLQASDARMPAYHQLQSQYETQRVRFGLEVDIDFDGGLLLRNEDRQQAQFIIGSIHSIPHIKNPGASPAFDGCVFGFA